MSDQPKRRFWQIHLSTLLLMAIVTGFFMHMNFRHGTSVTSRPDAESSLTVSNFGWPAHIEVRSWFRVIHGEWQFYDTEESKSKLESLAIPLDAIVFIMAIHFTVVLNENRIRRRKPPA